MTRALQWLLVIGAITLASLVVLDTIVDALASPKPIVAMLDDRTKLERARAYNRRLERILHQQITRAERNERAMLRTRRAARRALGTSPLGNHWLEDAFQCIHQHEGSWTDPGLPYYGGLQFDLDFQRAYGRDYLRYFGTADKWPVSVQLAVAIRGYISRGFQPWPNTRKPCGL